MTAKIPDELIEQIYNGNTVLFIGSGFLADAGVPTWSELVYNAVVWAEEHGIIMGEKKQELTHLIDKNEFLMVIGELREHMGNQLFNSFMHSIFRDNTRTPPPVYTILPEIPFAAVLTTNYDVMLEKVYAQCIGIIPHTYTYKDAPRLVESNKSKKFYILKMHGDINNFDTVALSHSDYQRFMLSDKAYYDFLKNLFITRTVLIVGFSHSDTDMMLLIDELGTTFKNYGGHHYALITAKEASSIKREFSERGYNIQIIFCEATNGHSEVYETLSKISKQVTERTVSFALKRIIPGLFGGNFVIEGSNPKAHKLFIEKLVEIIQKDKHYSSFVVQVNMEESSEEEFFKILGEKFLETIKEECFSTQIEWNEDISTSSMLDFERLVNSMISRMQNLEKKHIRIILLLFNADILNKFTMETKDKLRYILDVLGPELTAIIVTKELNIENSRWTVSPWYDRFLSARLQ